MNSNEYHVIDCFATGAASPLPWNSTDTNMITCPFCGKNWADHEHACPYGAPDDSTARGRAEDRMYADPRERS